MDYILFAQETVQKEPFELYNEEIQLLDNWTFPKTAAHLKWLSMCTAQEILTEMAIRDNSFNLLTSNNSAKNSTSKALEFCVMTSEQLTSTIWEHLTGIQFTDYVDDLRIVGKAFEKDERISGIHLIGHSQGSLVAALALTESDLNVKVLYPFCGPADGIGKVIVDQVSAQNEGLGKIAQNHVNELMETQQIKEVNPFLSPYLEKRINPFLLLMQYNPSKNHCQD